MKIKYSCRGPTDWSKLKLGDRVIIYEGWNIKIEKKYYGMEGTISSINPDIQSYFKVQYQDGLNIWVYPKNERKVLGKILN